MRPNSPVPVSVISLLIFSLLVLFTVEMISAGHKDDDDDYEDSDEGCYPGRNCKPGCYCGAHGECRPYFYEKPHIAKLKCGTYKYPQWKVHRKGSKHDGEHSSILFMPHLHKKSEVVKAYLERNNFTATDDLAMDLSTGTLNKLGLDLDKNSNNTSSGSDPTTTRPLTLPPALTTPIMEETDSSSSSSKPSEPLMTSSISESARSRSMRFLQRLHS